MSHADTPQIPTYVREMYRMDARLRTEVPSYQIKRLKRQRPPKMFIPSIGGAAPIGRIPVGLPSVDEDGVARRPFEKEGNPVRNFFASILYGLGIVLRSGR